MYDILLAFDWTPPSTALLRLTYIITSFDLTCLYFQWPEISALMKDEFFHLAKANHEDSEDPSSGKESGEQELKGRYYGDTRTLRW